MDISLTKIILLFLVYGIIGIIPLYWARISISRLEQFLSGLMLIFYASYLLSAVTITTGIARYLLDCNHGNTDIQSQLIDFIPYIFLFSFIYTFLFGGVGANYVTSSLLANKNIDIENVLIRIEEKIESISEKIDSDVILHKWVLILNIIIIVILLTLMANGL